MVEVAEHRPLEGLEELRRAHHPVVLLVAGSTGSRLRNFGNLRMQRKDLGHRSIERIALRSPSGCWRRVDLGLLGWLQLEIERLHNRRIHRRSSLDDHRLLAGSLGRSHAAEGDYL